MKSNPTTEKALEVFADLMIKKIESVSKDWTKPWFSKTANVAPRNLDGRYYNGSNTMMLMLCTEMRGYELPIFGTFDRFQKLNEDKSKPRVIIAKGSKSFPVFRMVFNVFDPKNNTRITFDEYQTLADAEKSKYNVYPSMRVYHVFNIAQTNIAEVRPELYAKLKNECGVGEEKEQGENKSHEAIDAMIDNNLFYCPINQVCGDRAYYKPSQDYIVIPKREQFFDGESFASNTLHECAHATGAAGRLNRLEKAVFGSDSYAIEELTAEMTAAVVCAKYGLTKHVSDDSAAYLKSWLKSLKKDTSYIKTILENVRKASKMIEERIEAVAEGKNMGFDKYHNEINK